MIRLLHCCKDYKTTKTKISRSLKNVFFGRAKCSNTQEIKQASMNDVRFKSRSKKRRKEEGKSPLLKGYWAGFLTGPLIYSDLAPAYSCADLRPLS